MRRVGFDMLKSVRFGGDFGIDHMQPLITQLTEAIYSEPRAGRSMPARIELGPDLFPAFQTAHREAMEAILPEADSVYPGSLCGVPIVEVNEPGAFLLRQDGQRGVLELSTR